MLRYAASAVPWRVVAVAACLVVALIELLSADPASLWALEGAAVGLLAGSSAICFDERGAAVVDAAPRSLAWRTAGRTAGPALLVVVWTGVVLHAGDASLFGHRDEILTQGWVAVLAGAALTSWARSGGSSSPGIRILLAVVPLTTAWALVRPLPRAVPVFPYANGRPPFSDWAASQVLWAAIGTVALITFAAAVTDTRWLPARIRAARLREPAPDMDQGPVRTSP